MANLDKISELQHLHQRKEIRQGHTESTDCHFVELRRERTADYEERAYPVGCTALRQHEFTYNRTLHLYLEMRLRYSEGVHCCLAAKTLLKVDIELNPDCSAMAFSRRSEFLSKLTACSTRRLLT